MEQKHSATKELIEKHRKNTAKYLHLVQDLVASGQKIDPEATKAKIEGKYGLKLKSGENLSVLSPISLEKDPVFPIKITNSSGEINHQQLENLIDSIRRKYVKSNFPVSVPLPVPTTPETSTSVQEMTISTPETPLIDLDFPVKLTEIDLLSGSLEKEKQDYSVDLAGIDFETPKLVMSPEPKVNETMPEMTELRKSGRKLKGKTEEIVGEMVREAVGKLFCREKQEEQEEMEIRPKRKVSPLRSFESYIKGDVESGKEVKTRPGRLKVTKAKIDPEVVLLEDRELQELVKKEKMLERRLAEITTEKTALEMELGICKDVGDY